MFLFDFLHPAGSSMWDYFGYILEWRQCIFTVYKCVHFIILFALVNAPLKILITIHKYLFRAREIGPCAITVDMRPVHCYL